MTENTKTLKTPGEKELVLRTRLTAGQRNALRRVMFKALDIEIEETHKPDSRPGDEPVRKAKLKDLHFDVLSDDREKALIEIGVESYDGKTTGIYETLLNESPEEYDFVVKSVDTTLTESGVSFF